MTQRQKLELKINSATELTLLYDEPIVGKSQYGDYFMYAVAVGDEEYSFFAPTEVHAELSKLGKGKKAIVTKLAANRNGKLVTTYDVKVAAAEIKVPVLVTDEQPEESEQHDRYFDIMLDSYRDAIEINRVLNGMIDIEKCAISLYISKTRQSNY